MVRTPCDGVDAEPIPAPSYLMVGERYIKSTSMSRAATRPTTTRYFRTDHLDPIAVITNEVGTELPSYNTLGAGWHPDPRTHCEASLWSPFQ